MKSNAARIEQKVVRVMKVYEQMMGLRNTEAKELFNMAYNTLKDNLDGKHHPKLDVLLNIFQGMFPDGEGRVFPDALKGSVKYLTPEEMHARIFAACMDDDAEKVKEVAGIMIKLADGKISSFSELEALLKKKRSDK